MIGFTCAGSNSVRLTGSSRAAPEERNAKGDEVKVSVGTGTGVGSSSRSRGSFSTGMVRRAMEMCSSSASKSAQSGRSQSMRASRSEATSRGSL